MWRGSCTCRSTTPVWLQTVLEAENACIADLDAHNRKLQRELALQSAARAKQDVDHEEQLRALRLELEQSKRHASELEQKLTLSEGRVAQAETWLQQERATAEQKRLEGANVAARSTREQLRALRTELDDSNRHASELEQRLRQSESAAPLRLQLQQQEAAHADEKRRLEAVRSAPASGLSACSPAVDRAQRIAAPGNASA